ncbi:MAG: UDP-N-acetylmuramoyl-L-alanine--D-glutamate ligase, partial [Oscillospiraceae bacterium]|nr:UDP-N-acetylmuramoyl-L-alanine--D-glutamate ligase [Oscillospiraceae bacterium]
TADAIERELRSCDGYSGNIRIERLENVPQCVSMARQIAEAGDVVLFSPASASFDMYSNFEERGRHFKSLVEDLV